MTGRGRTWRMALGAAVAATALLPFVAPGAGAQWSQFGGGPGRSGGQRVDEGGVPIEFAWSVANVANKDIRTSIVASAGPGNSQRLAYANEDGLLFVRELVTGKAVGPTGGVDLSAATLPFGSFGSVTPVESSTDASLGQVFAVHNELYDGGAVGLELAQVDEASGTRRDFVPDNAQDDLALTSTAGYRIESSPLLTPPDGAGNRVLFFVASDGVNERLFRIAIANPTSTIATIGAVQFTDDVNATPIASPALVRFNSAGGVETDYVAVGTTNGDLRTFAVADLAAGPVSLGAGAPLRTPAALAGAGTTRTAAVFAASSGAESTVVQRYSQTGSDQVLTRLEGPAVLGEAAPGLALSTDGRRVFLTTAKNLYGFDTSGLALTAKYRGTDDLAADTTGFRRTTAATTGAVVAVVTDGGQQLALDRDSLQPVEADLFVAAPQATGSTASFGQPAISRRFLVTATDRGVFAYGLRRATPPTGYWLAASDGGIFAYGDAPFLGSTGDLRLNRPIVAMVPTPTREGYWLVASDGGVFTFGDAGFFGSTGDLKLNSPIVGMVPLRTGQGYWLVAADGGVFSFPPDTPFFGSTGDIKLNKPIVGMAGTVTGEGYYLVASDGGIFAFGDAEFLGSTGDIRLNQPIVGMARVPAGGGYWLVASDGGVFAFGRRAPFFGSTGDITLNSPIVAITPSATGQGYLFTAADGGVFAFGDAPFLGSAAELGRLNRPVVTIAAKP